MPQVRGGRVLCAVRAALAVMALAAMAALSPQTAAAQSLIRDAEIEHALRQLARPLIAAAGLSPSQLRVLLIDDRQMNAFVIDGRTIFLHSGLLTRLGSAAQVQAVLAHELAHIANGHLARRAVNLGVAQSAAGIGMMLALAAAAAGEGEAAVGAAVGVSSAAQGRFLAHTRAEETSADQSGVRYMAAAGVPPAAAVEVLDLFRGQEALTTSRQAPYARTHPLSRDRIRALQGYVAAARPQPGADAAQADYWFARAQAKLAGFTQNPADALRRLAPGDDSDAAVMRRAVALHRQTRTDEALAQIDRLIARRPGDGYLLDLRAQFEFEAKRFAAAARTWARAAQAAPDEPLILAGQGRALLAAGDARAARAVLERAYARDPYNPILLRDLAVIHAGAGETGLASLVTAERYALAGRLRDAGLHARRAADLLPQGSPGWRRAQDMIRAAEAAERTRSKR